MNRRSFLGTTTAMATALPGCVGGPDSNQRQAVSDVTCSNGGTPRGQADSEYPDPVTGDWPSPQFDARNSAYNPEASGVGECPSKQWQFRVDEEKPHNSVHDSPQSPPVVRNGTLFVCDNENELYALDAATGRTQWTVPLRGWYVYGPTYAHGDLYLTADRHLQAISVRDRSERWARTPPDPTDDVEKDDQGWMPAAPAVRDGRIFAGTFHGVFCAFDSASGALEWYRPIPKHRPRQDDANPEQGFDESNAFAGQPAVGNGVVCVSNQNGRLYAFDVASGDQQWEFRPGDRLDTAPVIHDDTVYVTGASGIYAVSLSTGELVWSYRAGDTFSASAPAIARSTLVSVAGPDFPNRNLVALDATSGDLLWKTPAATGLDSNPSIGAETVVMGMDDGLLAVRLDSGDRSWRVRSERPIGAPVLVGDMVFAADGDGYVYALR